MTAITKTMGEYLDTWHGGPGIDLWIGRWIADYDDPDNFTFTLFHSRQRPPAQLFLLPGGRPLLEDARRESRPEAREVLYRKFENLMLDSAALVPLFHDVDYRIASPRVRGVALRSTAPYVNYAEIGKGAGRRPRRPPRGRREAASSRSLSPASCAASIRRSRRPPSRRKSSTSIFETLTHATQDARVVPWLASEVAPEAEGMRFRFRLRPGVRFHNGRPLTARDVRHSYERLLGNRESEARWFLSPVRGAKRMLSGEAADLEGFRILSPSEFVIELEKPDVLLPGVDLVRGDGDRPGRNAPRSARARGRGRSAPGHSAWWPSSRDAGWSSSATRTTGAEGIPEARGSFFGSA